MQRYNMKFKAVERTAIPRLRKRESYSFDYVYISKYEIGPVKSDWLRIGCSSIIETTIGGVDVTGIIAELSCFDNVRFGEIRMDGQYSPWVPYNNLVSHCIFRECSFADGKFFDLAFENTTFRDVSFSNCSFSSVVFRRCEIDSLLFEKCAFGSAEPFERINEVTGVPLTFEDCTFAREGDKERLKDVFGKYVVFRGKDGRVEA